MKTEAEYYIWHQGNKYILAKTASSAVAHALIEGIYNTEIAIHFEASPLGSVEAMASTYQIYDVFDLVVVAAPAPDPASASLIRLAQLRAKWLYKLEMHIHKYQSRFFGSFDPEIYAWLGQSLDRSTPDKLDPIIEEYAIIQKIDHSAAYYDLKMRWDSYAMVKVKAFSFFEKFKVLMNQCHSEAELQSTLLSCKYDLFLSAKI